MSGAHGYRASITSPRFSDNHSAFELGAILLTNTNFELYDLSYVNALFLTEQLRGYAKVGLGVVNKDEYSLVGSLIAGLEVFPALQSRYSLFCEVGGMESRVSDVDGLAGTIGAKFYF